MRIVGYEEARDEEAGLAQILSVSMSKRRHDRGGGARGRRSDFFF
jgi:hypothetical protein